MKVWELPLYGMKIKWDRKEAAIQWKAELLPIERIGSTGEM